MWCRAHHNGMCAAATQTLSLLRLPAQPQLNITWLTMEDFPSRTDATRKHYCNALLAREEGGASSGIISAFAGCSLPSVKSALRRSDAIARRGAARPVHISHWTHPCSNSSSTPSTISHPHSSAWKTNGVCRGIYAASRVTGRHRRSSGTRSSGRTYAVAPGRVLTTKSKRPAAATALTRFVSGP